MANDILVLGEVGGGGIKKITRELIGAARRVSQTAGGEIDAVLIGALAGKAAEGLTGFGLRKIIVAEDEILVRYSTEGYAKVVSDIVKRDGHSYLFLGATAMGRDLGPRVAARIDGVMFSDCVDVRMDGARCIARRPVYSGRVYVEIVRTGERLNLISIRPNNISPAEPSGGGTPIETHTPSVTRDAIRAIVTGMFPLEGGRPDLTEADIIVSGGRAMKDKANFRVLEGLADLLGAAVGASRAAVDSGFAPTAIQVGQTGKIVNPKLYIACGISGAIQHLAGMRTSKVIVAINKDPNAPIFERATYGIVGDLFEVVPMLTEELKKIL